MDQPFGLVSYKTIIHDGFGDGFTLNGSACKDFCYVYINGEKSSNKYLVGISNRKSTGSSKTP